MLHRFVGDGGTVELTGTKFQKCGGTGAKRENSGYRPLQGTSGEFIVDPFQKRSVPDPSESRAALKPYLFTYKK